MKTRLLSSFLIIAAVAFTARSAEIKFTATTERTRVTMGEQIVINATLVSDKNLGNPANPSVTPSSAYSVLGTDRRQSSSSSIQITNGKAVQKNEINYQFLYVITPQQNGSFVFPALEIVIDGVSYKTEPISFNVSNERVQNPDVRVSMYLNKKSLYTNEQAILTFKVAQKSNSQTDVRNGFSAAIGKVMDAFKKDFSLSPLFTNQITTTSENINGERYNIYALRFSLVPITAGSYSIAQIPFEYQELRKASSRSRGDPFFDDFFGMNNFFGGGMQAVPKSSLSGPFTIQVKPLPPAPPGFSGAVGRFTLNTSIDKSEVPAGEALTLKLTIKGSTKPGSMGDITLPQIPDCEIFKPETQVWADTGVSGITAKKLYKYLLIPRQEGTLVIPPVKFPYFDPETGKFKTAASEPVEITVTRGKAGTKQENRYMTQEEIREVGQDIRYIKTDVKLKNQTERPYREPVFYVLFPLPFLIIMLSLLYKFQYTRREKNAVFHVRRKALSSARRKLLQIKKQISKFSNSDYLGKISDTIEQFISQKFGFPATGRTLDELRAELLKYNSDEKTVADLTGFIEHLDSYRFGGSVLDEKSRSSILEKAESFIVGLEKGIKKEKAQ